MKISSSKRRQARLHRLFGKPKGITDVRDQIAYQALLTSRFAAAVAMIAVILNAIVAVVAISSLGLNIGAAEQARDSSLAQTETNRKLVEAAARQAEATVVVAKTSQDSLSANQRAWVGPVDATIVQPEALKPLKAMVTYGNSGRQPAPTVGDLSPKIYSIEDWNGGAAAADIEKFKADCLQLPMTDANARITFPTSGFNSFAIKYDGTQGSLRDVGRLSVTPELVSGAAVVALRGCFVYRTIEKVHRTTFCYFYQARVSDIAHLNFCTVGQGAD